MEAVKTQNKEKGISLLLVLLVGTLMLFTALAVGDYTKRMVQALRARSDAVQALYQAETAFECVKYWLNKDEKHFGPDAATTATGGEIICNDFQYDFSTNGPSGADNETQYFVDPIDSVTGVGEFRMYPSDSDTSTGVRVQVRRNDPLLPLFEGHVRVHSQTGAVTGTKTGERYQDYYYKLLHGADVMFVIDRSGSIEGDRTDRTAGGEWNVMLDGVIGAIGLLRQHVPSPHMGIVSFGTDPGDTGSVVTNGDCPPDTCLEPDVELTSIRNELITTLFSGETPIFNNDATDVYGPAQTNLSLALGIAGAELMDRYYPYDGPQTLDGPTRGVAFTGKASGEFERIVEAVRTSNNTPEGGADFAFIDLPTQGGHDGDHGDKPDARIPDVIVVVTDGMPNGIMSHRVNAAGTYADGGVVIDGGLPIFLTPVYRQYQIGEAKLFRINDSAPSGSIIIDDENDIDWQGAPTFPITEYQFCNDAHTEDPSGYFNPPLNVDTYPYYAMCNASIIANELEEAGIKIAVVYVRSIADPIGEEWLENHFASPEGAPGSDPLFAPIDNFEDLQNTILALFERMNLVESR